MIHPEKWRDTVNPYELGFTSFELTDILGYPHAGNDVFHVRGIYEGESVEAYIKVSRQTGADIANEVDIISRIDCPYAPKILDHDGNNFAVSLAKEGDRLSYIVGDNADKASHGYLYEYGRNLAILHGKQGDFAEVKDRKFFHIPDAEYCAEFGIESVRDYLMNNRPKTVNKCFCHGDFHYANILWKDGNLSAILDFELSGLGNKEFDIAWATILRPGQKFMNTEEEFALFMDGYNSVGRCNPDYVRYYMVLIYAYFYRIGRNTEGYQEYVREFFKKYCK